jgi:excisionase family DNA binding protein
MNVSRTTVYELIKRGDLHSVTVAGRRLIPASEAYRLLGKLGVRS